MDDNLIICFSNGCYNNLDDYDIKKTVHDGSKEQISTRITNNVNVSTVLIFDGV